MKTYKLINDGKLAEYDSKIADNKNFWSSHWGTKGVKDSIAKSKKGYMGGLDFLLDNIGDHDEILEAGCGKGQIVAALQAKNLNVTGVDFAEDIINEIKIVEPELNVYCGDLRDLKFKTNQFTTYLSFGVIEHFNKKKDLLSILNEAKRVTSNLFFFSVPYFSPILKKNIDRLEFKPNSNRQFFQYYFDKKEISDLMIKNGLKVEKYDFYGSYIGLRRYSKIFRFLEKFYIFRFYFGGPKHY